MPGTGPHPAIDNEDPGGFSGSAVVTEFASLIEAQAWADADHFYHNGRLRKSHRQAIQKSIALMSGVNSQRIVVICERFTTTLSPLTLDVIGESHKHVGHTGARQGSGHLVVKIVSAAFVDPGLLQRHRLVYDALGDPCTRKYIR